jgi:NIMA (never in mitosis gene a)-related kinase
MELASGGDLLSQVQKLKKKGLFFEETQIWKTLVDIARALKALHEMKILHRDLKGANVFLMSDGTAKVGDLNVSKVAKRGLVYTQTGTPYYASPEVWKDQPYDSKCDVWSLGVVIYEMAAQSPPFTGTDMQALYRKITRGGFAPIPSKYSESLGSVIRCLLQTHAKLRPSSAAILQMPVVTEQITRLNIPNDEFSPNKLLNTIKLPRHMASVNPFLPVPTYNRKVRYQSSSPSERASESASKENLPPVFVSRRSKGRLQDAGKDVALRKESSVECRRTRESDRKVRAQMCLGPRPDSRCQS